MNIITDLKEISELLNLNFELHKLKRLPIGNSNSLEIDNNKIFFYPVNDGFPTCGFEFYKNGNLIINNKKNYSEITNLDEILLNLVKTYSYSLDNEIVLDPYYFMLELTDGITPSYKGKASLVVTDKAIRNQFLNKDNFDEANKYYINHFLDHFMGWNFGLSINRNEVLKEALESLNTKVIYKHLRQYAGRGYEVCGNETEAVNGVQHYYLSTEVSKTLRRTI